MRRRSILVATFVVAALFVRPGPLPAQSQPPQSDKLVERLTRLEQAVGLDPNRPLPASFESRLAAIEKGLQAWATTQPASTTAPGPAPAVTAALERAFAREQDLARRVEQLERVAHQGAQAEYASATDMDTLRSRLERLDRDAAQVTQRVQRVEQDARSGTGGAIEDREARRGVDDLRQRLSDLALRVNSIETRR